MDETTAFHCPPKGWQCTRDVLHTGPCAARPQWWNLIARWRLRGLK